MITKKRTFLTAIQADNAEDFTRRMNEELEKRDAPKITYITNVPFTAYIEYVESREIPETLKEKYELNKDTRPCSACPYFRRTKDRRYKWHYCIQKQKAVTECQGACEVYYQMLESEVQNVERDHNGNI